MFSFWLCAFLVVIFFGWVGSWFDSSADEGKYKGTLFMTIAGKIIYTMTLMLVCVLAGCARFDEQVMAEDYRYRITAVEREGGTVLYSYDKKTEVTKELLVTSPRSRMFASLDYENICSVHKDSLLRIGKVKILWSYNETMYLAIEECADMSNPNTHTFIFNERSDSLIHLPTNAGLMGLTTEEGYLVMQSYECRYDVGGRYNVIDVYDVNGNLIYQVSLK